MTQIEEAEKAWNKYIVREGFSEMDTLFAAKRLVHDYKAALRAEIEKRISLLGPVNRSIRVDASVSALKDLLELLDTVTPKEK